MSKQLACGDVVDGCPAVFSGASEAEVLAKAAEHARTEHGLEQIPPELAARVKAAIKER